MRMTKTIRLSTLDAVLLATNVFALGALCALMLLRGPNVPTILLTIGAGGMAFGKIGGALARRARDESPSYGRSVDDP
jgi:hypothetical protein